MARQMKQCKNKAEKLCGKVKQKGTAFLVRVSPRLGSILFYSMMAGMILTFTCTPVYAVSDMWTVAKDIIKDVYKNVAAISTLLAGLMSAVAVIGAKLSNNQHKVDNAWDWLKRIWIAWAIINGIGAFIAYIVPLFNGLATLEPGGTTPTE